jgi:hypothetical protein
MSDTSFHFPSVLPSIYRCVVSIDRSPARSWTSRCAAVVMKLRRADSLDGFRYVT